MTAPENDLVVLPENEDVVPWSSLEGAGVVSSVADTVNATGLENGAWATTATGLDALGALMSPLDTLGTAGIGYLIEHLWFLHEPLDALAGDPTQITAQSRTWQNVADELRRLADEHRADVTAISGWDGAARDAYGATAIAYADDLRAVGDVAGELAELILGTGVSVATERAVVRDLIAEFIWNLIEKFLGWLVGAFFTAGGALAVGITMAVIDALDFAADLARRLATFLQGVQHASGTATALASRFRQVADSADAAQPHVLWRGLGAAHSLQTTGAAARHGIESAMSAGGAVTYLRQDNPLRPYSTAVDSYGGDLTGGVTELGKQYTSQRDNQEQWEQSR